MALGDSPALRIIFVSWSNSWERHYHQIQWGRTTRIWEVRVVLQQLPCGTDAQHGGRQKLLSIRQTTVYSERKQPDVRTLRARMDKDSHRTLAKHVRGQPKSQGIQTPCFHRHPSTVFSSIQSSSISLHTVTTLSFELLKPRPRADILFQSSPDSPESVQVWKWRYLYQLASLYHTILHLIIEIGMVIFSELNSSHVLVCCYWKDRWLRGFKLLRIE